jgi:membrane protease YdiL (CAAX protease family)
MIAAQMATSQVSTAQLSTAQWITFSVLAAVAAGSLVGWFLVIRRMRRGLEPLPFEPRPPINWTGAETLLVIAAYLASGSAAGSLARWVYGKDLAQAAPVAIGAGTPAASIVEKLSPLSILLQGKVVGDVLFLLIALAIFRFARPTPSEQIGLSARPLFDLRTGLAAFVVIVPPVILLQVGLTKLIGESVHPVLVGLKHSPDDALWIWSTIAVVGTAPLLEEFLFRGVIQNWLTRAWSFAANPMVTVAGEIVPPSPRAVAFAQYGPIVATAVLFALVHLGNGPDPIPLFFLALGLGYLFRQTNRIWACWIVHLLLNAFSVSVVPLVR